LRRQDHAGQVPEARRPARVVGGSHWAFVKAYNPATAHADIEAAEATARAGASGATKLGFYQWILNFNPQIQPLTNEYNKKFPDAQVQIQVAPESNFSTQKFLLEARNKTSSWDI